MRNHIKALPAAVLSALAALSSYACQFGGSQAGPPGADAGNHAPSGDDGGSPDGTAGDGGTVQVQILAFNDFHGNLLPPSPTNGAVLAKKGDPRVANASPVDNGDGTVTVQAGGAAFFATHLATLRQQNPNTLVVSSGDLTGAAPLLSNVYTDEPTVDVMNAIGLDLEGVGNHDFDHGAPGVLRFQNGGCNYATDVDAGFGELGSCVISPMFPGAKFTYLAANVDVVDAAAASIPDGGPASGTLFPPYVVKTVGGAKIALIGMTLHGTPSIVSGGLPGLSFEDEVATANALVPMLKAQNVDAIGVLLHQGGFQTGTYDECVAPTGSEIQRIANALDPAVTFIHSAHTHIAYNCTMAGRPVTQAASFGRVITQYTLSIDTARHKVVSAMANNVPVTRDVTPDPKILGMVQGYLQDIAPLADTVVGYIGANVSKIPGANGEAPLGDVITDGMLAAANQYVAQNPTMFPDGDMKADVAFTNIGGIRDGLFYDTTGFISLPDGGTLPQGEVTYQQTQAIEPFGDVVDIVECTGAQLIAVVQQNTFVGSTQLLQQSGLTYSWSSTAALDGGTGAADPSSFAIVGSGGTSTPLDPNANYYVAGLTFFTNGGDGYTAFKACKQIATVGLDLQIFDAYLTSQTSTQSPLAPPPANRITRTN
jgi:5'-nucleotidase